MTVDLIIFGGAIVLLIISAIGGGIEIDKIKIPKQTTLNRLLCATGGVFLIGLGIYLKQPQLQPVMNEASICTNYDIKILTPRPSEAVGGQFKVSGTYTSKPQVGRVQLFFSFDGKEYWHHGIVQFDQSKKTWIGDVNITGAPGREAFIMVAIVGKSGRILLDYANKIGAETTQWPSFSELTDDIVECDRVQIITK